MLGSSQHNGVRVSRVTARRSPGPDPGCEVRQLKRTCLAALAQRPGRLEIDLTGVTRIDSDLLECLVSVARTAREGQSAVKVIPSISLDRWLAQCGLDHCLRPLRRIA